MKMKTLLTASLIFFYFAAFTQTWLGTDAGTPNDWNTAANWSPANVPTTGADITIPSGCPAYPKLSGLATANSITIASGASLTILPDGELTVTTLTNNAGTGGLILKSDATGTATLIHNSDNVPATVENYLNGSGVQFKNVSSPVDITPISMFAGHTFYYYDETADDYWGTAPVNLGWTKITTGNMEVLKGYAYYIGNETINYQGNLNYNSSNFNISLSYTEHSGDTPQGDSYILYDGWNLVGNPYTSYLDWEQLGLTFLDETVYYYDGGTENYAYYNLTGPVSVNGGSKYIAPGQGFFVKADAVGNIEIPNATRLHKSQKTAEKTGSDISDFVKISIKANNYTDETVLRFIDDASNDFESKYDAYKRFTSKKEVPQIYSVNSNIKYAINSMKADKESVTIQLGFVCITGKQYQINFDNINLSQYGFVYLEDKLTGKTIEMKKGEKYTFDYENDTQNKERFILHIEKSALSVNNINKENINIYPNPANDYIYVIADANASYKISNITGKIILSGNLDGDKKISTSELSKGVYFIKVDTKNKISVKRIVIQ